MSWEVFERLWKEYVEWYSRNRVTASNEAKTIAEALRGLEPPCADVGAGHGVFTPKECIALEPSQAMGSVARASGLQVLMGRAERLPFRSEGLRYLLTAFTLCFMEDPKAFMKEAARVLRHEGFLVTCIITRDSPWGRLYEKLGKEGHPFYSSARFYSLGEVLNMVAPFGFELEGTVASIRYRPDERPSEETPSPYTGREAFVCAKFKRP